MSLAPVEVEIASDSSQRLVFFSPAPSESGDFHLTYGKATNPGNSRPNRVVTWGYNQSNDGGTTVVSGEAALAYRLESFYAPLNGREYFEAHLQYVNADNHVYRPIAVTIDRESDDIQFDIQAQRFNVIDNSDVIIFRVNEDNTIVESKFQMVVTTNNITALAQRNAAGTQNITLARLSETDTLILGPNNGNTTQITGNLSVPSGVLSVSGSGTNQITATGASSGTPVVVKCVGGANADGSYATIRITNSQDSVGAQVHGGRWASNNRGARFAGRSSAGNETVWFHANAESNEAYIATGSTTRVSVSSGATTLDNLLRLRSYAVSALPLASSWERGVAYASDLSSTNRGDIASGGGSGKGLVFSNGTNWLVL